MPDITHATENQMFGRLLLPSSTFQDTLVAVQALLEYTMTDTNRNIFDMSVQLEASSMPYWRRTIDLTVNNYTNLVQTYIVRTLITNT